MVTKVWLRPPRGEGGEPIEVEATPEVLTPLLVKGYSQYFPPEDNESESQPIRERETEVDDHAG